MNEPLLLDRLRAFRRWLINDPYVEGGRLFWEGHAVEVREELDRRIPELLEPEPTAEARGTVAHDGSR